MITRDLDDDKTILIRQEDHAELSAQFASHWGNGVFACLAPYESMVFAATYHDSQFRDVEADLPMDLEAGRPYGHRTTPFSPKNLDALRDNIDWIEARDSYAALIVSMHHTGLPQNRYGVIQSWQTKPGAASKRPMRPEIEQSVRALEAEQRATLDRLAQENPKAEAEIRFNYRMMQVFDLLSLYFCCDGYGETGMTEMTIGPVPVAYGSDREVDLRIVPTGPASVRLDPFPFDLSPLPIAITGRVVHRRAGSSLPDCRTEFFKAPRANLGWTITS